MTHKTILHISNHQISMLLDDHTNFSPIIAVYSNQVLAIEARLWMLDL